MPIFALGETHVEARLERVGSKEVGAVVINRDVAVRLLTANGSLSAADRASAAADRLRTAVNSGHGARIEAKHSEGSWSITAGKSVLLYITRAEARAHGSSQATLAMRWAAEIRRLIALPVITLSASHLLIPLGETRTLTVGGSADELWDVSVPTGSMIAVPHLQGRQVVVRGLTVGRTQVMVKAENHTARCEVMVKKYAGWPGATVEASVTGQPAPSGLLNEAAGLAIRRSLPHEPGTHVILLASTHACRGLQPGQVMTLTAPIRLGGGDYIPVRGIAHVRVYNRRLPENGVPQLLFSNSPERVKYLGALFNGSLSSDAPTRLFYHHVNNLRVPIALSVTLVNPGDTPVTLQIVSGVTAPDPDAMRAGYRAGQAFFRHYLNNVGEIYVLPARSSIPLAVHKLRPEQTASGIAQVRLLQPHDGRCLVRVAAESWSRTTWPRNAVSGLDAWHQVLPRQATRFECAATPPSAAVFPCPVKQIEAQYIVGKPWAWIRLGQEPIKDASGAHRLDGDYGVIYSIHVTVENPTAERRQVEVAFEPGAGGASGVFTLGGRYIEAPNTAANQERSLARFSLAPSEKRVLNIQTVPLGGSAYPAALIVR